MPRRAMVRLPGSARIQSHAWSTSSSGTITRRTIIHRTANWFATRYAGPRTASTKLAGGAGFQPAILYEASRAVGQVANLRGTGVPALNLVAALLVWGGQSWPQPPLGRLALGVLDAHYCLTRTPIHKPVGK